MTGSSTSKFRPPVEVAEQLIAERPAMHMGGSVHASADLGVSNELLRWLARNLERGSRTLETGSGLSTIVFLAAGCRHTAIAPVSSEIEALRRWCADNGVDAAALDYHDGGSQDVLPRLPPAEYDAVLVDGDHAFPLPIIDWYYVAGQLRPGGVVLVDDTQLRPPRLLRDFLDSEPEWQLVEDVTRTAIFRRTDGGKATGKIWNEQPWSNVHYAVPGDPRNIRFAALRTQLRLRTRAKQILSRR